MLALFIIVVVAGVLTPFFIEDDKNKKEVVLNYILVLTDVLLLIGMVYSDLAGIPGYGKPESIAIGGGLIMVVLCAKRINKLINGKNISLIIHHKGKKAQSHKTAS